MDSLALWHSLQNTNMWANVCILAGFDQIQLKVCFMQDKFCLLFANKILLMQTLSFQQHELTQKCFDYSIEILHFFFPEIM